LPSLKSLGIAYFTPVLAAVLIILLIVICGITEFQFSPALIEKKGGLSAALIAVLVMAPTLGMIAPIVSGLGEEIGWRGYLHSQLENLSANRRYLITGLIWSLWHWPLIIFGDYATSNIPAINVLFFTVAATTLSFLMGYLRDTTKSVFPAAIIHGSHKHVDTGNFSCVFLRQHN
jgi:membrane protease YdiL (CAAX protease family)